MASGQAADILMILSGLVAGAQQARRDRELERRQREKEALERRAKQASINVDLARGEELRLGNLRKRRELQDDIMQALLPPITAMGRRAVSNVSTAAAPGMAGMVAPALDRGMEMAARSPEDRVKALENMAKAWTAKAKIIKARKDIEKAQRDTFRAQGEEIIPAMMGMSGAGAYGAGAVGRGWRDVRTFDIRTPTGEVRRVARPVTELMGEGEVIQPAPQQVQFPRDQESMYRRVLQNAATLGGIGAESISRLLTGAASPADVMNAKATLQEYARQLLLPTRDRDTGEEIPPSLADTREADIARQAIEWLDTLAQTGQTEPSPAVPAAPAGQTRVPTDEEIIQMYLGQGQ